MVFIFPILAQTGLCALVEIAKVAETNGWDSFFIWNHIYASDFPEGNVLDSFIVLTAIASQTKKLRLGTTVKSLARRSLGKLLEKPFRWTICPLGDSI
jgi:alkanesulfonate monooxygenase SsuD/methylene tetrahydromethanopterin reductase-like flavin-dependent oxidoreductase (luciferase family)